MSYSKKVRHYSTGQDAAFKRHYQEEYRHTEVNAQLDSAANQDVKNEINEETEQEVIDRCQTQETYRNS